MSRLLPPLCLLLALLMVIAGFCVLAVDQPQAGVELHQARAAGDEAYREVLEKQLAGRQRSRWLLIGGLFGGSVLLTITSFLTMCDANSQ